MTQTTDITKGPLEGELDHLSPCGTTSFLMPNLVKPEMELDQNGWVVVHVLNIRWHICNPECGSKRAHNILHLVDLSGYVLKTGKRIVAHIKNFNIETGHGIMELEPKVNVPFK